MFPTTLVTLLVLVQAPPGPREEERLLVLPIEARQGVSKDAADMATSLMTERIRRISSLTTLSYREVEGAMTQEQRKMLAGCDAASCAAEIAGALNVDQIVIGRLGRLGQNYVLDVSRIRQRDARPLGSSVRQFAATDEGAIADQIGPAVDDLFAQPRGREEPVRTREAPPVNVVIAAPQEPEKPLVVRLAVLALRGVGSVGLAGSVLILLGAVVAGLTSAVLVSLYALGFYVFGGAGRAVNPASASTLYLLGASGSLGLVVSLGVGLLALFVGVIHLGFLVAAVLLN